MNTTPSILTIFYTFLKLGCTSFGGPIAHLGYFNHELIKQRQWLGNEAYAQLVGLCHFIPGPTSSQVGLGIGYQLQGWRGAVAAWTGFTLPSALLMTIVAVGLINNNQLFSTTAIHYLKLVALAVVAQAIWQMSRSLLQHYLAKACCLFAAAILLIVPSFITQFMILGVMGIIGYYFFKPEDISQNNKATTATYKSLLIGGLVFTILLIGLPIISHTFDVSWLNLVDSMYRSGALVFGGGHVVLPLLQQEVMSYQLIAEESLLTGYGLAQAIPGPLFTLSSYIGALWMPQSPWAGATIATFAIFLPSFILLPAILPVWQRLQYHTSARAILAGLNVGVIALLISVFYKPLFTSSILSAQDAAIALTVFAGLHFLKWPAWTFVVATLIIGTLI